MHSKVEKVIELLEKQEALDLLCYDKAGIKKPTDGIKCLCLAVELGELANEVQVWKYWKAKKNIDRGKIKKEFADCLHFALSNLNHFLKSQSEDDEIAIKRKRELRAKRAIENYEDWIKSYYIEEEKDDILVEELLRAFQRACRGYSASSLAQILVIGFLLDMSFEEIVESYENVYADNINRVQGDY